MTPRRDQPTGVASLVKLVAIALVLLSAWFVRTRDGSAPVVAGPTTTTPRTESAPRAGETARRQPATAPADVSSRSSRDERYDLEADETRGHTLARHVGQTDAQLRERLARDTGITTASTYATRALAERTVARTLRENADRLQAWTSRTGYRPNLALDYHGPRAEVLGRSIRRGNDPVDCTDAVVVLRWDGRHYFVLTSYPEPSR